MDVPNIPPGPLSRETAERLSRLLVAITQNQAGGYPATPPPSFHGGTWASESVNDDYVNRELWGRLTGYDADTGWYAWEEVISTSPDTTETPVYETKPGGRTGTVEENPAWEKAGVAVDYSGQPVVRLRREHWREDVGWCWVFVADSPTGSVTFNETDVYCIADVLKVYTREVAVTVTNGALSQSYGDWVYSHDAGCCACDTVTTCCAPCADGTATNVYLHVAVQTGPAGSTGYPSCYDCYDLQLQYDAESGAWGGSTCIGSSACCDDELPARVFMLMEDVAYNGDCGPSFVFTPPTWLTDLEGTYVPMTYAGTGGYDNPYYTATESGPVTNPVSANITATFIYSLCTSAGYPGEHASILASCETCVACSVEPTYDTPANLRCFGVLSQSLVFAAGTPASCLSTTPCQALTATEMTASFIAATVGDDGETPCPCVDFSWQCNETTDTYELVVSYDDGGTTVATTYQPNASPDPCVGKEWVYESVALPDGSSATIYANCNPTHACANDSGSGSGGGGCNLARVDHGSTMGAESVSLSGVLVEEGQLLVVVLAYRAASAITPDVTFDGPTMLGLDAATSVYNTDFDMAVAVFIAEITAPDAGTGDVVVTVTGADRLAVSVFCVEGLTAFTSEGANYDAATGTTPGVTIGPLTGDCHYLCLAIATNGGSDDTHGTWTTGWTDGGQDVGGVSSDPNPLYLCEGYRFYEENGGSPSGAKTGVTSRNWIALGVAFE